MKKLCTGVSIRCLQFMDVTVPNIFQYRRGVKRIVRIVTWNFIRLALEALAHGKVTAYTLAFPNQITNQKESTRGTTETRFNGLPCRAESFQTLRC